jgi:hypothetical protein
LAHPFAKFSPSQLGTDVWVVLAAGSNTYSNYRHQADMCHMYQVAHSFGIPDEHIINFMYDDIANSPSNPRPGVIINEPNGPDVYHGVVKDYVKGDVTHTNFLKVLEGIPPNVGSNKVLNTTDKDYVFVFYDDHGTNGALCWPASLGCPLTGPVFEASIQRMAAKKMFKELVIYIEACYAGSVFYKSKLPPNVYVTTASPVDASSFAYNYDSTIRAYVADIYSFLAIHDTEVNGLSRSWNDQFAYIQDNIQNYSMACQYGDLEFAKTRLQDFWPTKSEKRRFGANAVRITDAVPAWDVPYAVARKIYESEPTLDHLAALKKEEMFRDKVNGMAERIMESMEVEKHLTLPPCTTCVKTCPCMSYCYGSAENCRLQCCDQQGCYVDPPADFYNPQTHEACSTILTNAFREKCGYDHDYLRSVDGKIVRACRSLKAKVHNALKAIEIECARN